MCRRSQPGPVGGRSQMAAYRDAGDEPGEGNGRQGNDAQERTDHDRPGSGSLAGEVQSTAEEDRPAQQAADQLATPTDTWT